MEQPIELGAVAKPRGLIRTKEAVPQLQKRTRPLEVAVRSVLLFCGIVSIFTTLGIVYILGSQALLFLDSRAFVRAKIAIADTEATAMIAESVDADERTITLEFEGDRVPYNNNQLIMIGDEIMRIVERGGRTIRVERGVNDTTAVIHEVDQAIFGMNDQQIRLQNELTDSPDDNVLELLAGYGAVFEVGTDIQLNTEIMTIETVNPDSLVVTRIPSAIVMDAQRTQLLESAVGSWEAEQQLAFVETAFNHGYVDLNDYVTQAELQQTIVRSFSRETLEAEVNDILATNNLSVIVTAQLGVGSVADVDLEALSDAQLQTIIVQVLPENDLRALTTRPLNSEERQAFQLASLTAPENEDIAIETLINGFNDDNSFDNLVNADLIDSAFADELSASLLSVSGLREHEANDEAIDTEEPVSVIEFFTNTNWAPQVGEFGILPLMLSTMIITFIAILVAIPLGLGAAIFLSEYADPRLRNILKPMLEILAGVPTVVYGFFALSFVTPILQDVFGGAVQFNNLLSAGLVVGILLVPLISSMSEDALTAVPRALREASYGLGATRLETSVKVVLPAAISGIMSAVILAISRAVGETMIVAIAAGNGPNFTFNVFEGAETMTGHIARISGGDLSYNSIDYNSIFAIGLILFVMTLLLNIFSGWIASRLREEY